jgi:hypothetical protein
MNIREFKEEGRTEITGKCGCSSVVSILKFLFVEKDPKIQKSKK